MIVKSLLKYQSRSLVASRSCRHFLGTGAGRLGHDLGIAAGAAGIAIGLADAVAAQAAGRPVVARTDLRPGIGASAAGYGQRFLRKLGLRHHELEGLRTVIAQG